MIRTFRLLPILSLVVALSGCLDLANDSTNTLIKDSTNTAETKKAILFLREGGTTVADSYQVSVVDYNNEFDKSATGNTFIVDDDHGVAWLNPKCVDFKWLANDTLVITYDNKLRVFLQQRASNDVTVTYQSTN